MHGDPGEVISAPLDFTGMHFHAEFYAELARTVTYREPRLDRPRRTVERCQNGITGALDLTTAETPS